MEDYNRFMIYLMTITIDLIFFIISGFGYGWEPGLYIFSAAFLVFSAIELYNQDWL